MVFIYKCTSWPHKRQSKRKRKRKNARTLSDVFGLWKPFPEISSLLYNEGALYYFPGDSLKELQQNLHRHIHQVASNVIFFVKKRSEPTSESRHNDEDAYSDAHRSVCTYLTSRRELSSRTLSIKPQPLLCPSLLPAISLVILFARIESFVWTSYIAQYLNTGTEL